MIGVFCNGPWNGYGFAFSIDDAIEFSDHGLLTARLIGGREPLKVRAGVRVDAGDTRVAVYRIDPEMTRLHGWVFGESGIPVKATLFTFDREWTARLVAR